MKNTVILAGIVFLLTGPVSGAGSSEVRESGYFEMIPVSRFKTYNKQYRLSKKRITVSASGRLPASKFTYTAENAIDGSARTAWCEGAEGPGKGEWIKLKLDLRGKQCSLFSLILLPGYGKTKDLFYKNNRLKTVYVEDRKNGICERWNIADRYGYQEFLFSGDLPGGKIYEITLFIEEVHRGRKYDDTCISEICPVVFPRGEKNAVPYIRNSAQLMAFFRSGGTARIAPGNYNLLPVELDGKKTANDRLVLTSKGKAVIYIDGEKYLTYTRFLDLKNFKYVHFENIIFQNNNPGSNYLNFQNIHNIRLLNSKFLGVISFSIKGCNVLQARKSRFTAGDSVWIYADVNSRVTIQNCLFDAGLGGSIHINDRVFADNLDGKSAAEFTGIDITVTDNVFFSYFEAYGSFIKDFMERYKSKEELLPLLRQYRSEQKKWLFIHDVQYRLTPKGTVEFSFIMDDYLFNIIRNKRNDYNVRFHCKRTRKPGFDYVVIGEGFRYYIKLNYPQKGKLKLLYNEFWD